MPRHKASLLLWPAVFTCLATAILVSLGVWQLHRLTWKEGLIAAIEARANAVPQPLPPIAEWPKLRPGDYEYRHVTAEGTFENNKETLLYRASSGAAAQQPGYQVLTPLRLTSGGIVIVNRGFVPLDRKEQSSRLSGLIQGETKVTGLMRQPEVAQFLHAFRRSRRWPLFHPRPRLIAKHFGLAPAAPFSIDADDGPVPGGWPKGGVTERNLPNNHLSYALTWFGLALTLIGVFTALCVARR